MVPGRKQKDPAQLKHELREVRQQLKDNDTKLKYISDRLEHSRLQQASAADGTAFHDAVAELEKQYQEVRSQRAMFEDQQRSLERERDILSSEIIAQATEPDCEEELIHPGALRKVQSWLDKINFAVATEV